MTDLIVKNRKIARSDLNTFNYGIPALYSKRHNLVTCPGAGKCAKPCFARQTTYTWDQVVNAYEYRLAISLTDEFTYMMFDEIVSKGAERIRIHDSGDFYSREYLNKWLLIIDSLPHVEFYCYTKRVSMLKSTPSRDNFTVIYSFGGVEDHLIDVEVDRHSRVFLDKKEIKENNYINASVFDDLALGANRRIGLIYHGANKKRSRL